MAVWLHRHAHVNAIGLQLSYPVGILVVDIASQKVVHGSTVEPLSLRYRAFLVSKQEGLEINNFLTELGDGCRKGIVFRTEQLHLGLKVGQPLLLTLTAFECGHPRTRVSVYTVLRK